MSVTVRPFAAGLGADISGVDVREPLRTVDRDAIRAAWLANLVLRFRGQPMTDEQHMAFTRQFGELEFNPAALMARQSAGSATARHTGTPTARSEEILLLCRSSVRHTVRPAGRFPLAGRGVASA